MDEHVRFAARTAALGGERVAAWDIHHDAMIALGRGEDVIVLSVGDPEFPTPQAIIEAATTALDAGDTHYTEVTGRPMLREAIARDHALRTGQTVGPENVIVLAGAQNGLFATSLCLFDPGDEVVTFDPMYLTYEASIRVSGAVVVPVPQPAEGGFRLDARSLAAAITPRTRAIWFANPSNPTGVVYSRGELEAIAALARRHDLWVVADEVYGTLTFDRPQVSIAALPGMAERTVTIDSLSKSHAMTGWRTGWVVAPASLVNHLSNVAMCMLYGLPGFVQEAVRVAVDAGDRITAPMRDIYRRRRDLAYALLKDVPGLVCLKPEAGMFMLVDVRGTGLSTHEFSWMLYRETGVAVLDAKAFGPAASGFVRVSFTVADDTLAEACGRIAAFVQRRLAINAA